MPIKTVAFDLYGTLLSTASIESSLPIPAASVRNAVTTAWRKHQLEYTWRLNSMSQYIDFSSITRLSLLNALHECGGGGGGGGGVVVVSPSPSPSPSSSPLLTDAEVEAVLLEYGRLEAYDDVAEMLAGLAGDVDPVVFSNGTPEMVAEGIRSAGLSVGIEEEAALRWVSVHGARTYKPTGKAYHYLLETLGREAQDVVLVSGNPFDIVGADAVGMGTVWVDREGKGWADGLGRPKQTVRSLSELGKALKKLDDEHA